MVRKTRKTRKSKTLRLIQRESLRLDLELGIQLPIHKTPLENTKKEKGKKYEERF